MGPAVLGAVALLLGLGGCGTQSVNIKAFSQGAVDLKAKNIQSLAVSDFEGPEDSGKAVADLFTAALSQGRYYRVVERDKLAALEKEQVLGMTGVVDDKMAAKAGKVLGVDAIVVGKVADWSAREEPYTVTVMQQQATGTTHVECDQKGVCRNVPDYRQVPVQQSHNRRSGNVSVSFRVVRADTGEVVAGKQATSSYVFDSAKYNQYSDGPELASDAIRSTLAQKVISGLMAEFHPTVTTAKVVFETDDPELERGVALVKANRLEDAITHYEQLVSRNPGSSGAQYDLGTCYALAGEYDKADRAFRAAEQLNPKSLYMESVGRLKGMREKKFRFMEVQ